MTAVAFVAEPALLPLDARDCFSFTDTAIVARAAITEFLSSTGITTRGMQPDANGEIERLARERISGWDVGDIKSGLLEGSLILGVRLATLAYGHTAPNVQVYIALLTMLTLCIDDFAFPRAALDVFTENLYRNAPQLHPLLDHMVEVVSETNEHYPSYATKDIIKSIIEFVDSCALEHEVSRMVLRPGALSYVMSKRHYNGIGRAYSFLVWDKNSFPDVCDYLQAIPELEKHIDYVNDIFSFYKEELAGERGNFVSERAVVTSKGVSAALFDIMHEAVSATLTVRRILEGTSAGRACEMAMAGYTAWHCLSSRYRLKELFGSTSHSLPVNF